jgi:hypothetical protein
MSQNAGPDHKLFQPAIRFSNTALSRVSTPIIVDRIDVEVAGKHNDHHSSNQYTMHNSTKKHNCTDSKHISAALTLFKLITANATNTGKKVSDKSGPSVTVEGADYVMETSHLHHTWLATSSTTNQINDLLHSYNFSCLRKAPNNATVSNFAATGEHHGLFAMLTIITKILPSMFTWSRESCRKLQPA